MAKPIDGFNVEIRKKTWLIFPYYEIFISWKEQEEWRGTKWKRNHVYTVDLGLPWALTYNGARNLSKKIIKELCTPKPKFKVISDEKMKGCE